MEHPGVRKIVELSFRDFFRNNLLNYPEFQKKEIGFAGSVAYHFQGILKETAKEFGCQRIKICAEPLNGLVNYHL